MFSQRFRSRNSRVQRFSYCRCVSSSFELTKLGKSVAALFGGSPTGIGGGGGRESGTAAEGIGGGGGGATGLLPD